MSWPERPTVAITGASGYLGSLIRARCDSEGWRTVGLTRAPRDAARRAYSLDHPPDPDLLEGVDVLVHCAYDLGLRTEADIWRVNVGGTGSLLELATRSQVRRTIVLSSMSAYSGTRQLYGRAKLDIEEQARRAGALSVRPGLVYGPNAGGMAGALTSLTRLPVVPVVAPDALQFTVHEEDFVEVILALVLADEISPGPIGVASPVPLRFREVIEGLARLSGRSCRTVPFDWQVLLAALRLCERTGIALPFRSDSLLGLVHPAPCVPNLEVVARLGLTLRRFEAPVPSPPDPARH